MGSSGWTIPLEADGESERAPWSELESATLDFLWETWRKLLPSEMFSRAWAWVSVGSDSLLTLGARDQDPDQPVERLEFWFYLSVEWPSELAEHWLNLALASGRAELERRLAELGYRLSSPATYRMFDSLMHHFVRVGDRLGLVEDANMFWAMPEYEWQSTATLSAEALAAIERSTASDQCDCPMCVALGVGREG